MAKVSAKLVQTGNEIAFAEDQVIRELYDFDGIRIKSRFRKISGEQGEQGV